MTRSDLVVVFIAPIFGKISLTCEIKIFAALSVATALYRRATKQQDRKGAST
jgi:hypothetical protein